MLVGSCVVVTVEDPVPFMNCCRSVMACTIASEGRGAIVAELRTLGETFALYVLPETDVLHRVARARTGQPADAEDLAQETLLRAYRSGLPGDTAPHQVEDRVQDRPTGVFLRAPTPAGGAIHQEFTHDQSRRAQRPPTVIDSSPKIEIQDAR